MHVYAVNYTMGPNAFCPRCGKVRYNMSKLGRGLELCKDCSELFKLEQLQNLEKYKKMFPPEQTAVRVGNSFETFIDTLAVKQEDLAPKSTPLTEAAKKELDEVKSEESFEDFINNLS